MPNAKFDAKSFNPEAFKYIMDRIPRTRLNEIRKSKVLVGNPDIRAVLGTQNGTGYARVAVRGLLDGEAVNYDGQTDITATSTKTFEQGVVVIGRAKAWVEKDFSFDITGGVDFMNNVAQQVADYDGMEKACRRKGKRTTVYYCHPHAPHERGSNENMNRIIRRFFPKGTNFDEVPISEIRRAEEWMNNYPREVLGWQTAATLLRSYMSAC